MRLVVLDYAAVWRDARLAVGKCIKSINHLVARSSGLEIYDYFSLVGGVVVDFADFYFALLLRLENGIDERGSILSVGQVVDYESLVVALLDFGTHAHLTAPLAIVVTAHVDISARSLEVGIKLEFLAAEISHGSIEQLIEVVRKDFARQTHSDTLGALGEQQRELHREGDRLLFAAVVGESPVGDFRAIDHVEGKVGKTGFDVTSGGSAVAGEHVAPVTLSLDKHFLLT